MKTIIVVIILWTYASASVIGQTIEYIKDPNGYEVFLSKDSSYLINTGSSLLFFTIDEESDSRNVLWTDGISSRWILNSGFDKTSTYSSFTEISEDQYIFRAGNIWYLSDLSTATTEVFYDNGASNQLEYLKLYESESVDGIINNLIIEAKDKVTNDTLHFYHLTEVNSTIPFGLKMRIHKAEMPSIGSLKGNLILASVYDGTSQTWGSVALYREFIRNLTRLMPLVPKVKYDVNFTTLIGNKIVVEHFDDGSKRAYRYYINTDTCTDITSILFPDHTLLEFQNPKWTAFGLPNVPELSYNDYFWKGRNQSNTVQYFMSGALEDVEIVDLRNVAKVDFMYSESNPDSIFYYNYANTQRGLMRYHIYNEGTKKDPTSLPFNQEFKLRGYSNKLYFGRYNTQSGSIEAMTKNFPTNSYSYIQSDDHKRIENPLDFEFIEKKVFVISRTNEGRKLVVFDPDGIVAIPDIEDYRDKVSIYPNPSRSQFNLSISNEIVDLPDLNIVLYDVAGLKISSTKVHQKLTEVKIPDSKQGSYYLSLKSGDKVLYSQSLLKMD